MAKKKYIFRELQIPEPDTRIFIPPNQYGYQVNISHPLIKPLYDRFKVWKKIPPWCPLSDDERFEFENYIFKYFGHKRT